MFSSLFRSRSSRHRSRRPSSTTYQYSATERSSLLPRNGDPSGDDDGNDEDYQTEDDEHELDEENDLDDPAPLLPIFSAAHLDSIPVYNLTHAVRILIIQKCETTLSWDQLRSPQISQFLVKPIQTQIRSSHFSRATLYALIANCLQFQKEAQLTPAIVGICKTRALLAELLAVRLLREYSVRELIDALSYDFDPLAQAAALVGPNSTGPKLNVARSARTSTLEVAIRAQAKRFLAHPVVVRHLEAIWAGAIVFHNAADGLHRFPSKPKPSQSRHYGATHPQMSTSVDARTAEPPKDLPSTTRHGETIRRSVTLYDPSNASLFKLSRLRVPRYRQTFSMISYAVMLGLFLAVLAERSYDITALEVVFWFWSAGFMLDEVVGFTEQGFGLYIMSVWNAFDIGILMLFLAYYLLRLFGIVIANDDKERVAAMAYDTLASTAVLLFPRLFSLLDHYRYFSQLLIAFRLMAQDLAAVLVLIVISCSGFFVAFTFSFSDGTLSGSRVAYSLFQILMGFTPAAWDVWAQYNILGKIILTLFLIICHFLVVTILVTVLTNSFMAIVKNAEEEHQFLFAVNTISMVKSDALFSYVAPSNIIGWMFTPLRYIVPFRQFVRFNRSLIKLTHVPILFLIFAYERMLLSPYIFDPVDQIEKPRRGRTPQRPPTFSLSRPKGQVASIFSPGDRVREPSVTTYFKDRALDEVFRRPFQDQSVSRQTSRQPPPDPERRTSVVDLWMTGVGNQGGASPPMEQPRSILEQLEDGRRPPMHRSKTSQLLSMRAREVSSTSRSVISDPEERPRTLRRRRLRDDEVQELPEMSMDDQPHATDADADGDDELHGNEDDEKDTTTLQLHDSDKENSGEIQSPMSARKERPRRIPGSMSPGTLARVMEDLPSNSNLEDSPRSTSSPKERVHNRNASTNTILFRPLDHRRDSAGSSFRSSPKQRMLSSRPGSAMRSSPPVQHSPRRPVTASKTRPVVYSKHLSTPNVQRLLDLGTREGRREPSMDTLALDLASDIGDNRESGGHFLGLDGVGGGSFQTNFFETMKRRSAMGRGGGGRGNGRGRGRDEDGASDAMTRLVLTRMNSLEEGFKDMLKEVKEWRSADASRAGSQQASGAETPLLPLRMRAAKKRMAAERDVAQGPSSSTKAGEDDA
ncbi:hypothetical protein FH972_026605 [Carpinus fangiana]|uniref:Ion transport domain-containing protein n=1 Tax=Carpinus fangiana TaxID=176857 RepID=A0A5N6L4H1_9ROSI|nr:hypothetical protein FH972_026605 [Carpinus fangiana]